MTREGQAVRTGRGRAPARSRSGLASAFASMLALSASVSGCLCVPAPSSVVEWAPEAPRAGRTRIAGAVHPDAPPRIDPALARTAGFQPTPVPALEQPLGDAADVAIGPASDIRVPSIPPSPEYPIDLATALRLAERDNPLIGVVRARIVEALGNLQRARVEILPALNAGVDYDGHAGNLQQSRGTILDVSRQSVYFGGGAFAVGPMPPLVPAVFINEPLADALYDPLAARQYLNVARADAAALTNTVLLEVTRYYLDLLGASARLEAERRSTVEAEEIMRINQRYAQSGEGRPADFHRARAEWRIRRAEVRKAEEDVAVASARLCRRLHLDPSTRIRPLSDSLEILALVDLDGDLESLIQTGISRRPEVGAAGANLAANRVRLRQEVARPFIPSLFLGFSGGAFGGGSNISPPLVGNFAGRTDLDVALYWTLLNGGLGNLLAQKHHRALVGAATARQARTVAMVREEVASAHGDARARREQVEIARQRFEIAVEGFRRDLERAFQADPNRPGNTPRPIEVINSLELLVEARRQLVRTIIDYDQAQFRLFVAMGSPPPLEHPTDPAAMPITIAGLAAPVTSLPPGLRPPGDNAEPAAPPAPGTAPRR